MVTVHNKSLFELINNVHGYCYYKQVQIYDYANPRCREHNFEFAYKGLRFKYAVNRDMTENYDFVYYSIINEIDVLKRKGDKLEMEHGIRETDRFNYYAPRPTFIGGVARPKIKEVIFHDPATIVIWKDGSKTVVKCGPGDTFDKEKGLAMCISKKVMGTNKSQANFNDIFKKWCE